MNNYIFFNFINLLKLLFITISSLFNMIYYDESKINSYNLDQIKTSYEDKQVEKYETIEKFTFSLPYGEKRKIEEGHDGIYYFINNETITLKPRVDEVFQVGIRKKGEYTGLITAYGPDCIGCSPEGFVYCNTREGKNHSLIYDGIYYNDINYENLRILAADHREFPCGTIIELSNNDFNQPILGIVLDTGFSMRKAYDNDKVHMDLAFDNEENIKNIFSTNYDTNFKVKRWGW